MPKENVVKCMVKGSACNAVRVSWEEGEVTIDPRVCLQCELMKGESKLTLPIFTIQPPRPPTIRILPEILPARPPLSITTNNV
ncbi:MAG: hypothetical protein QXF77_04770 [Candidatus Jordarchaeales archaeon]